METRAAVADYRSAERKLTLYFSTQIPHLLRTLCRSYRRARRKAARRRARGRRRIRRQGNLYADEVLTCFVSMKIGKPVKWIETRRENFVATIQGRGHADFYEIAAKRDGTILAHSSQDHPGYGCLSPGAHVAHPCSQRPDAAGFVPLQNIFRRSRRRLHQLHSDRCVPRRGPSRSHFGIERMVDLLAAELKMDPAEMRLKNFIRDEEFPFLTGPGLLYDSGAYSQTLNKALDIVDYSSSCAMSSAGCAAKAAISASASRRTARSAPSARPRIHSPAAGRAQRYASSRPAT